MAIYHVWSGAGGAGTGANWTNAFTTYASAVAAANANGDVIKVHYAHTEQLTNDTTYTYLADVYVVSVDKDDSDALRVMGTAAWIGNSTTNRGVYLAGARAVRHYGITFRTAGTTGDNIRVSQTNGANHSFQRCYFWQGNTNGAQHINVGFLDSVTITEMIDCTLRFGNVGQGLSVGGNLRIVGGEISSAGSVPNSLFYGIGQDPGGCVVAVDGFDASYMGSGTLIGSSTTNAIVVTMRGCKLGSGFGMLAAQPHATGAGPELWLHDCASGDVHINIAHANTLGSTVVDTGIYVTADVEQLSWRVSTTADASAAKPYCSPRVSRYLPASVGAITPYIEIERDDSTAAFDNDEVWANFFIKKTSGVPLTTLVSNSPAPLASPSANAAGIGLGSWTGESGTAWSGKLEAPASQTPAEDGYIQAQVCCALPSQTLYVSPRIRW